MPRRAVPQQRFVAPKRRPVKARSRVRRNPSFRAGTTYSGTATNLGTVATAPTFTYTSTGAYASVFLENATAGKTVWLAQALVNGDVLSVDFLARTVTLNGSTVSAVTGESRWWDLAPGANTIRSNIPAAVEWRNAYTG